MDTPDPRVGHQHEVWEAWAQADPLWAILSAPQFQGGRGEIDDFFQTGRTEVDEVISHVASRGVQLEFGRCLDFGCGVGRLTQALAMHFDEAVGVDISETMVELADKYNQCGDRVRYDVNRVDDLSRYRDDSFDFIFTTIVLQHNSPELAKGYMREFFRILRAGGVVLFDMPAKLVGEAMQPGSHLARIEVEALPDLWVAGAEAELTATVTNLSAHPWPANENIRFGNHWRSTDGSVVRYDDGRTSLGQTVQPGGTVQFRLPVVVPLEPGRYLLDLDMVEEAVTWFQGEGSEIHTSAVEVIAVESPVATPSLEGVADGDPKPEPYDMNGVPRAEVEELIAEANGTVVAVERSGMAGDIWESYRYLAYKREPLVDTRSGRTAGVRRFGWRGRQPDALGDLHRGEHVVDERGQ